MVTRTGWFQNYLTLHMIALFFMLDMENMKVYHINKINFDKHPKTSLITLE